MNVTFATDCILLLPAKTGSSRKEFNRLLADCDLRKIEIVITKNISRFGRNTVEILDALNQLKH